MFKYEFEVYRFSEVPENLREKVLSVINASLQNTYDSQSDMIDAISNSTLFVRIRTSKEHKDLYYPVPIDMLSSEMKMLMMLKDDNQNAV